MSMDGLFRAGPAIWRQSSVNRTAVKDVKRAVKKSRGKAKALVRTTVESATVEPSPVRAVSVHSRSWAAASWGRTVMVAVTSYVPWGTAKVAYGLDGGPMAWVL